MNERATLYLVHHAQTKADSAPGGERLNGWRQSPLTADGRARAGAVGAWFKTHLGPDGVGDIYSSDLRRATETGDIIQDATGADENTPRDNLRSWNTGIATGLNQEEAAPMLDDHMTRHWAPIPGGESYGTFLRRWSEGLDQLLHDAIREEKPCIAVTHSHNLNALPHLLSHGTEPILRETPVGPGGIIALHLDDFGRRITPEIVKDFPEPQPAEPADAES